jgi:hypothetical protein
MLIKLECAGFYSVSRWRDSNPRPFDYKSNALPLSYTGKKSKNTIHKKTPWNSGGQMYEIIT